VSRWIHIVGTEPATSVTRPDLPTYATVADVLEKKNGSGLRLAGWTVARTAMIAPPMLAVGVPLRQAIAGSALASCLISLFTLLRIKGAHDRQITLVQGTPRRACGRFAAIYPEGMP
jgi:hypothetical protein